MINPSKGIFGESLFLRKLVLGIPVQASSENHATANAVGAPAVLSLSFATQQGDSSHHPNDSTRFRKACIFTNRVRGGRSLRLPTEPCVRVHTRLLMQGVSIGKRQTNAPVFGRIVFPGLSG